MTDFNAAAWQNCRAGPGLGVYEVDLLLQREYGYGLDGGDAGGNGAGAAAGA
jgi:hypothetical protein